MGQRQSVIVNSPGHKEYHGKKMYIRSTSININSKGEKCTWYSLSFDTDSNTFYDRLSLTEHQVIINDAKELKILCILQNAYTDGERLENVRFSSYVNQLLYFKVNPNNKSGKRMLNICEGNEMHFSNVCNQWFDNSRKKGETNLDHLRAVLSASVFDLYIVCGSQAQAAVKQLGEEMKQPVVFMPHPASRSLTNKLCDDVKRFIVEEGFKKFPIAQFKRYPGKNHKFLSFTNFELTIK